MTTAIPETAAQLEEMLADDKVVAQLGSEEGRARFTQAIAAYARATVERDAGQAKQVKDQVNAQFLELLKANGFTTDGAPSQARNRAERRAERVSSQDKGHFHNPHAIGAKLDGRFESVGQLLSDIALEKLGNSESAARLGKIRNDFSSSIPSDGGILIPEEFRSELMTNSLEGELTRPNARVIPMGTSRIDFPFLEDFDHSGALFGGVIAYWTEEMGRLVNSSAKFGRFTLDAQKLTMRTSLPNEMIQDSQVSVTAFVEQYFPDALAWQSDEGFMRGNGVGMPTGWLTSKNTCMEVVAAEGGQTADTIVKNNLLKMYSRMLPTSLGKAKWYANIDTFPTLANLSASDNSPVWMGGGYGAGMVGGPPLTILGRPVVFTEKMETVGDQNDIVFADLSYYTIGDRQQMTAMWSEHIEFDTDSTAYRLIARMDGKPSLKKSITPKKGANKLSPFVTLAAR